MQCLGHEKTPILMIPSVSYPHILTQRHKPYWGDDADKFDPDRFLDERVRAYLTPNPFLFVPFNAGPRIVRPPHVPVVCS